MKFSLRHQSDGIIYPYITKSGHLMMRGFLRKIYVHNCLNVPTDQPVLLAANHPTAFVDPCLLCTFIDAPLYNMTRGDVFRKPFYRKLMESINMFPVFRHRDGYTNRGRNDEVFEFCRRKLADHRVVTIYVEGEHHLEKRVRPIQKGIIRIAFGTYAVQPNPQLQIIPAGCNYVFGDRPRDEAMVNIGTPLYVRDYWEEYLSDPNAAAARLSADIEKGLKQVCFHVEDPKDDVLAEHLLTLLRSDHPYALVPIVVYDNRRFLAEKAVCNRINDMPLETKIQLKHQTARYFAALAENDLSDEALRQPQRGAWHRLALFGLFLLPFLLGYLSSWPVIGLSKYVAKKTVKKREFYSSVRMGVAHLGGMLYYSLIFLASLFSWNPWCIALALALPALGWFSMFYRENWARWSAARRAIRHPKRSELLEMRSAIRY